MGGTTLLVPDMVRAGLVTWLLASTRPSENLVLRGNGVLLEAVRNPKLGPSMVARASAVAHTCLLYELEGVVGMTSAPSWRNISRWSASCQCSVTLSSRKRKMSMPLTSIGRPVAGTLLKSPLCVPR